MAISSYTNYSNDSGVDVHKTTGTELLMHDSTITGEQLATSQLTSNLAVTVYDSGVLSDASPAQSIENIYSNGLVRGGNVTNHTVQNVLYGGRVNGTIYGSNVSSTTNVNTVPTSTITSNFETVDNGMIKQTNTIRVTSEAYTVMTMADVNADGANRGSAIVRNNALVSGVQMQDGGRLFVRTGGKASNVVVAGAGNVDVLNGAELYGMSAAEGYNSAQEANHVTIQNYNRVYSSAVYGIPVSGYPINNDYAWYSAADSSMTNPILNKVTVTDVTNRALCSCVVSDVDSEVNGTYSLLLDGVQDTDAFFMSAREAIWKKTTDSSLTQYYAIEYATHDDGYPYWDLNLVSMTHVDSGTKVVESASRTLKYFAPAYVDTIVSSSIPIAEAKNPGVNVNVYSNAYVSGVQVPCYGNMTVMPYGIVGTGDIQNYGMLNVRKYAKVGENHVSCINVSDNAKVVVNVPGTQTTVYLSNNHVVEDETGSASVLPTIYIKRYVNNTSVGNITVAGSQVAAGTIITNGDTVYTSSGTVINDATVVNGGVLFMNTGVNASQIIISSGGLLNLANHASANAVDVMENGSIVIDPAAKGTIGLSSGANVNLYVSRYISCHTVNGNIPTLGYDATMLTGCTWNKTTDVTACTLTKTNDSTISYNFTSKYVSTVDGVTTSGSSSFTGSMSKVVLDDHTIIYSQNALSNGVTLPFNCYIVDYSESLKLVKCDNVASSEGDIASAYLSNHNLVGLTYTNYTLPEGVNAVVNLTDRVALQSSVTDNVTSAGLIINKPNKCTVIVSGDVKVDGASITSAEETKIVLNGVSSATDDSSIKYGVHIPELKNIDAAGGFVLSAGAYAKANTIPLKTQLTTYSPITLLGTLDPTSSQVLSIAQGSNYQVVSTNTNNNSTYINGLVVKSGMDTNVGVNTRVYAPYIDSNTSMAALTGNYTDGAHVGSNGILTVANGAIVQHAVADGSSAIVSAVAGAKLCVDAEDRIDMYKYIKCNGSMVASAKMLTLSKGYTQSGYTNNAAHKVFTTMKPVVCGEIFDAQPIMDEPFWYGSTSVIPEDSSIGVAASACSANIGAAMYFDNTIYYRDMTYVGGDNTAPNARKWYNDVYQMEYISSTDTRPVTSGTYINQEIGSLLPDKWAFIRYTNNGRSAIRDFQILPSAAFIRFWPNTYYIEACNVTHETSGNLSYDLYTRLEYIGSAGTTNWGLGYRSPIQYNTDGIHNWCYYTKNSSSVLLYTAPVSSVTYVGESNTIVSAALEGENNGVNMVIKRIGSDAEGNESSVNYHKAGSWTNNGSTFYDSGVIATSAGRITVRNKTLLGATVLNAGTLYVSSGAYVYNVTQEAGGNINTDFNRGTFFVNGYTYLNESSVQGKLDDYVKVFGETITGDTNRYTLSMVDTLVEGDNRTWQNITESLKDVYTINKTLTLFTDNNAWKMSVEEITRYTNPVTQFKNAISGGSNEDTLLQKTVWANGHITFGSSKDLKINGTSIGTMSHVTYVNDAPYVPTSYNVPSERVAKFPMSTLFVTTNTGDHLVTASNTDVVFYTYDSKYGSYFSQDTLTGIVTSSAANIVTLEDTGKHTRDPWWISGVKSEYNTYNPNVFTGAQTITRLNTTEFEVANVTNQYMFSRYVKGNTITTTSGSGSSYLMFRNCFVTNANLYAQNCTIAKNCSCVIGYIRNYNGGITENATLSGGNGFDWSTDPTIYYIKNVVIGSGSYLSNSFSGAKPNKSSYQIDAGRAQVYPVTPIVLSGSGARGIHICYANISGYLPICDYYAEQCLSYCSMYMNTPYNIGSKSYVHQNDRYQSDNHDVAVDNINVTHDWYGGNWWSGSYIYYISAPVWSKPIMKNRVCGDDSAIWMKRNHISIDTICNTLNSNIVISKTDMPSGIPQEWVTPALTTVRSRGYNYTNTQKPFEASDYVDPHNWSSATYTNSWHAPVFTSAVAATDFTTISGAANHYIYNNVSNAVTVSSTIVHMKPGTMIGYNSEVTMGVSGGLFVDAHAIAFDINDSSNESSTTTFPAVSGSYIERTFHNTHLQCIAAMHNGLVIVQPMADRWDGNWNHDYNSNTYSGCTGWNSPAIWRGDAHVVWGKTRTYSGSANVLFGSYGGVKEITDTYSNGGWGIYGESQEDSRYRAYTRYIGVFGNMFLGSNSAAWDTNRADVTVSNHGLQYIGSQGYLHCRNYYVNGGGVLLIDHGGKIDANTITLYGNASMIVMDGADVDFNERIPVYTSRTGSAVEGAVYYTRSGTGAYNDRYIYTSLSINPGETLPASCFQMTSGDMRYRISPYAKIKIMSNFVLSNVPNNDRTDHLIISSGSYASYYDVPQLSCYWAYDVPRSDAIASSNYPVVFSRTESVNVVSNIAYPIFKTTNAFNQVFTMEYKNVTDPLTQSTFTGWCITGNLEHVPGVVTSNVDLYACKHHNPVGSDWMRISGRYITPVISCGNVCSHFTSLHFVYDCANTDVTSLYNGINKDNYPTIVHVNGYVSGSVSGAPLLGECGLYDASTSTAGTGSSVVCYTDYLDIYGIEPTVTNDVSIDLYGCSILDGQMPNVATQGIIYINAPEEPSYDKDTLVITGYITKKYTGRDETTGDPIYEDITPFDISGEYVKTPDPVDPSGPPTWENTAKGLYLSYDSSHWGLHQSDSSAEPTGLLGVIIEAIHSGADLSGNIYLPVDVYPELYGAAIPTAGTAYKFLSDPTHVNEVRLGINKNGKYINYRTGTPVEPVSIRNYVISNNNSVTSNTYFNMVVKNCSFIQSSGAPTNTLICGQVMSNVHVTNMKLRTLATVNQFSVGSGATVSFDSHIYKAEVYGSADVTMHGKNIIVRSGGCLNLAPYYDLDVKLISSAFGPMVLGSNYTFRHISSNVDTGVSGPQERRWSCVVDPSIIIRPVPANTGETVQWRLSCNGSEMAIGDGIYEQSPQEVCDDDKIVISTNCMSGIPLIDNLLVESGGSAYISGYVTNFSSAAGAVLLGYVNPKYIRTSRFFDEDYNW